MDYIATRVQVAISSRNLLTFFLCLSINTSNAAVAQSVEQRTENPRVNSSILFGGTVDHLF